MFEEVVMKLWLSNLVLFLVFSVYGLALDKNSSYFKVLDFVVSFLFWVGVCLTITWIWGITP